MNKNLNKFLKNKKSSIIKAIELIDKTEYRQCFVVDKNNKLLGSITDGDIRRGLIKKFSLDSNVIKIANKKPSYQKKSSYEKFSQSIKCIPIVNQKKQIIKIKFNKIKTKKIECALIMAGGKGTRLFPLTRNIPKALVKINNKSLLESMINKLKKDGFNNIAISVHHLSQKIKDHIKVKKIKNVKVSYINEKKPLGTAGAISKIKFKDEHFLLLNCDVKLNIDFSKIIDFHISNKSDITIISKRLIEKSPFGLINLDQKFRVRNIYEKPTLTKYISAGAYIFKSKIKKILKKNQRIDMDQLIKIAIKKNYRVVSYPLYENWNDLGTMNSLIKYKRYINK